MLITHAEVIPIEFRLRRPFTVAYDTQETAPMVLLRLETDSGLVGWGCAAPDPRVTGEDAATAGLVLKENLAPLLRGTDPLRPQWIHERMSRLAPGSPAAKAAVSIALHDILGKQAGLPLYRLLGAYRRRILACASIGILEVTETVEEARLLVARGYRVLKLKTGKDPEGDIERTRRVRESVGREIRIGIDGNQGYDAETALRVLAALDPVDIDFCEQPTRAEDLQSLREVSRRSKVPIVADELVLSLRDSLRLVKRYFADRINVKLMKCGGIAQALKINAVAEAGKIPVMAGCMDESAISIAAGLAFALSSRNIVLADLDGHLDLVDDVATGGVILKDGYLHPVEQPGLGVEVTLP